MIYNRFISGIKMAFWGVIKNYQGYKHPCF